MKYLIVYSSNTGNTEIIAQAIKAELDENSCVYYGKPAGVLTHDAEVIFVGFWVFLGSCTEEMKKYLGTLENKKIFLFGTAGWGGSAVYFEKILNDIKHYIHGSNTIVDSCMCQGKMTHNVLERYEKKLEEEPDNANTKSMIKNYNDALSHPDVQDIEAVKVRVKSMKEFTL